jgi:hypothetical protein
MTFNSFTVYSLSLGILDLDSGGSSLERWTLVSIICELEDSAAVAGWQHTQAGLVTGLSTKNLYFLCPGKQQLAGLLEGRLAL